MSLAAEFSRTTLTLQCFTACPQAEWPQVSGEGLLGQRWLLAAWGDSIGTGSAAGGYGRAKVPQWRVRSEGVLSCTDRHS